MVATTRLVTDLAKKTAKTVALVPGIHRRARGRDFTMLVYHRLGSRGMEIELAPRMFARHLAFLKERQLAVTLDDAIAGDSGGVVVTVDDGYRDFYDSMLPLLIDFEIPVVLYLATESVEQQCAEAGTAGPLDWSQLREAVATGLVNVGSHTHTHRDLRSVGYEASLEEMKRSRDLIEDHLQVRCRHFAYPWGISSSGAAVAASELFDTAAVVDWRTNRAESLDLMNLSRIPVVRSDGRFLFGSKAAGGLSHEASVYRAFARGPWRPPSEGGGVGDRIRAAGDAKPRDVSIDPAGRSLRVAHITTVDLTLRFLLKGQLKALVEAGCEVTAISAPGPWANELAADGIRHIPWTRATRSWRPLRDIAAFKELLNILRRERFDVVHTHNPKPGILGRVAARFARVPFVINTVHGFYSTPDDPARRRIPVMAAEWIAARFSDLELYQSEEDLRWARRIGVVPADRSRLLGNGTDLELFRPGAVPEETRRRLRDELGIPSDDVVVGIVGRMVAEKGFGEFLEAARRISSVHPESKFLAVGAADPEKSDSLNDAVLRERHPAVMFTGWREDIRDVMSLMDIFVLPSYREGLPRSAVEAAAMGKPLVLTDIRGCREVVRNGVEGLLVPARDAPALTHAIAMLVDDPDLRDRMGKAARARAEDRFDERRVFAEVVRSTCGDRSQALLERDMEVV